LIRIVEGVYASSGLTSLVKATCMLQSLRRLVLTGLPTDTNNYSR